VVFYVIIYLTIFLEYCFKFNNSILIILLFFNLSFSSRGGDILALEEIKEIKRVEEEASGIIKSAETQSKDALKAAQAEAAEKYNTTLAEIKARAKALVDEGVFAAEKEAAAILEKGRGDISDILDLPKNKLDSASKLIIERIVNGNGNS
jgi:V/A-type H+/Na+-transporting ATPase subunit G/H